MAGKSNQKVTLVTDIWAPDGKGGTKVYLAGEPIDADLVPADFPGIVAGKSGRVVEQKPFDLGAELDAMTIKEMRDYAADQDPAIDLAGKRTTKEIKDAILGGHEVKILGDTGKPTGGHEE